VKKLYLIRHAKSSWKDLELSDFDRPLNKRGKEDAPLMGELLAQMGVVPGAIYSSPAKRAKRTAKIIAQKVGFNKDINFIDRVYEASSYELLDLIRSFSDKYSSVFLFGHNPGFSLLAEDLSGEYVENIPTSGIYAISFDIEKWRDVGEGEGKAIGFWYPKKDLLIYQ